MNKQELTKNNVPITEAKEIANGLGFSSFFKAGDIARVPAKPKKPNIPAILFLRSTELREASRLIISSDNLSMRLFALDVAA